MNKTKIEWADITWNPVVGCNTGCPYCYAKKMNNRFKWIPKWDNPVFFPHKLDIKFPKKPSRIFVNSMSDIKFWEHGWMYSVLDKIKAHPEHVFLFLTKFPEVYKQYKFPKNCWLGVSAEGVPDSNIWVWAISAARGNMPLGNKIFISIEPLLEEPTHKALAWLGNFDWVIVGGLTPKPVHKKEWVDKITDRCFECGIPLFLKNNLRLIGAQQFPSWMGEEK